MKPPIERLQEIMAALRAPNGCPWDREQTHETIKPQLIEECYEALEAIDQKDMKGLREELGDVLLHVVFHSQLAKEDGDFTFDDVATTVSDKLVRRHPHVFGNVEAKDTETVLKNWNEIKKLEKPERTGFFDGIPLQLPALMRSQELQKKAAKTGFDWKDASGVLEKVREELEELSQEMQAEGSKERIEEEFGDLLLVLCNLARHLKFDAEQALTRGNSKFQKRFEAMQALLERGGKKIEDCTFDEMNVAWDEVKRDGK